MLQLPGPDHANPVAATQFNPADRSFESDQEYFFRRAAEERQAAEKSANDAARRAHLELSARYASLAAAIEEASTKLG